MKKRSIKKKSQSSVITIVLIIIVVLVAIIILWNVVSNSLKSSANQVNVDAFSFRGDLKYSLAPDFKTISVSVHRGSGGGTINGIKLIFEDKNGASNIYENYSYFPGELETNDYKLNGSKVNPPLVDFSNLKKVSVYYIYDQNGKNVTTTMEVASSESTSSDIPSPLCSYGNWTNQRCGENGCAIGQMYQNRVVLGGIGCEDTTQCNSSVDICNLIAGAVSYWKFDEASWSGTAGEVKDALGINNGTGQGLANTIADSHYGRAGNFNGNTGNYIKTINTAKFISSQNQSHSVFAWIRVYNSTPVQSIWSYGEVVDHQYTSGLGISAGKLGWLSNGGPDIQLSGITIPTNKWVFVGMTVNSTNLIIYLNSSSYKTSSSSYPLINTNPHLIGASAQNEVLNDWFNGTIDEVMLFNRSLSSDEVNQIYNY